MVMRYRTIDHVRPIARSQFKIRNFRLFQDGCGKCTPLEQSTYDDTGWHTMIGRQHKMAGYYRTTSGLSEVLLVPRSLFLGHMELSGSFRTPSGPKFQLPWVIVRHTVRARTEFYGFSQPVRPCIPISNPCLKVVHAHLSVTGFLRQSYGVHTGLCGVYTGALPTDPRVCLVVWPCIGLVRDPNGLKNRTGPALSPYVLNPASICILDIVWPPNDWLSCGYLKG